MNGSRQGANRYLVLVGLVLFMAYVGVFVALLQQGREDAARGMEPLYTDFIQLYAASKLLQEGRPTELYSVADLHAAYLETARAIYGESLSDAQARRVTYSPWQYPPTFMFYVYPLAWVGYFPALLGWLVVTGMLYAVSVREALGDRLGWVLALAAPPVFFNLFQGQTGFLSAGFIALGLVCLRSQPVAAGILIGLAAGKPHLGVLLPVALAFGGYWKTFITASLTVIGMVLLNLTIFGAAPWQHYMGTFVYSFSAFEAGFVRLDWITSPLGGSLLAGASPALAKSVQAGFTLASVVAVAYVWRRDSGVDHALRYALLCIAALLCVPAAYLYDLLLLVPAVGWLWRDMTRHGAASWESSALLLLLFVSLFQMGPGRDWHLPFGLLSVGGLFAFTLYRIRMGSRQDRLV